MRSVARPRRGLNAPFTAAYPITGAESSVGAFRLTGFDQAGNSAQSAALILIRDISGPVMSTAEAPGTSGLMIPVRWQATDGQAGVRGYDVEYRVKPAGSWTTLLSGTARVQTEFTGEEGLSYRFRVRAVDNVGNASAWVEGEPSTVQTTVTKYYHLAGQRVAMRQGSTISYLYGDHLGSTSLVADAAGATLTETRYEPYGQPYWQWGATRTDFGFTGQRLDGFGLMDYNARYYSSTLGRFISPDTIIPQPGSPLAWDRYSYTNNNPVNGVDPSGHWVETAFDLISLGMSINDIRNEGFTFWNAVSLVSDAASVVLPFVPAAISHAIRTAKVVNSAVNALDTTTDAYKVVDSALDIANNVDNVADGSKTYRAASDGFPFNWSPTRNDITVNPPGLSCSVGCEGMSYQEIFEMSVGGRQARPGDSLYQVDTNVLQNSRFGLISDPIDGKNPFHAVTGGGMVNQWTNLTKKEFRSLWTEIWSYPMPE